MIDTSTIFPYILLITNTFFVHYYISHMILKPIILPIRHIIIYSLSLTTHMNKLLNSTILLSVLLIATHCSIYTKYYQEAIEIAQAMTIDQLIGQTIQTDFYTIAQKNFTDLDMVSRYHLGSLLVGGNGCPDQTGNLYIFGGEDDDATANIYAQADMERWQKFAAKFDNSTEKVTTSKGKTYHISLFLATDAVHNNQHVAGTILFPHNIGLSCSHNPQHFYNTGKWTGINVKKSGFNYAFAPTVAVSHNPQWGRYYETMGQDQKWIYKYAQAYTEGLQGKSGALSGVIGSVKHYIGDGATMYGADEGNVHVGSWKTFLHRNSQGYNASIKAQIATVMCSYSAINFLPMAFSPLLKTHLRETLKFDGFVIGDYNQIVKTIYQQLPTDLHTGLDVHKASSMIMNAGTDMMMIPSKQDVDNYIQGMHEALQNNDVTLDRLQQAVARIISVKLAFGVAKLQSPSSIREQQQQTIQQSQYQSVSQTTQYEDSLKAVHESLVLVKNQKVLPLNKQQLKYIVLVGQRIINVDYKDQLYLNYNNIGLQCGGWSVRWQGFEGNLLWQGANKIKTNASSILDALVRTPQRFNLVYPNYTTLRDRPKIDYERSAYLEQLKNQRKDMNAQNTLILATVGESPYAEMCGDVGIPYCEGEDHDGCLYFGNAYIFGQQRYNLGLDYTDFDKDVIRTIKQQDSNIPILTVLFAGRPMHMNSIVEQSSAVLHAFLPGTSGGQGVVDAIMGDYILRPKGQNDTVNTLSFDWPIRSQQLQKFPVYAADGSIPKIDQPMFKEGHGLSTAPV